MNTQTRLAATKAPHPSSRSRPGDIHLPDDPNDDDFALSSSSPILHTLPLGPPTPMLPTSPKKDHAPGPLLIPAVYRQSKRLRYAPNRPDNVYSDN
jgi:hypothetical protein